MSEAFRVPEREYSSPSSTDARDELAEMIANHINIPDAKALVLGLMAGFEINRKETSLILYDGGQMEYLIQRFLVAKKVKGCTNNTCKLYTQNLHKAFKVINKDPLQCSHTDIQAYIATLIVRKLSKSYQQNIVRTLSSFYAWLTREELIEKNIMLKIDPIKNTPKHKKAFTDMDVEKIRMACRTSRETAIVEVLLSTGCRIFEVSELRVEQCRRDEIEIIGKGEKPRTVYLNAKAQLAVERYLNDRRDNNPYLFPASVCVGASATESVQRLKGGAEWYMRPDQVSEYMHIDKSSLEAIIRKIGKHAGVQNCHPHRFRRTCATFALRRGMDVTLVQQMLGHESLATTQRYLDLSEEDLKNAHRRFVT